MIAHQETTHLSVRSDHFSTTGSALSSAAPTTCPSLLMRIWRGLLAVGAGMDAGTRIAHGIEVPSDHPARRCSVTTTSSSDG
ncbi:hypothetical protein WBG06_13020 [Nocardioides sp. CCNWLW239]|uniref:hypothetical protein n=1 Tax=Nocardioides sp. CCNWLW239 TaxID=3128902 RepID=UPI00301AC036